MLESFELCLAQDGEQARRLRRLGARDVVAAGDLKAAATPLPVDEAALRRLRAEIGAAAPLARGEHSSGRGGSRGRCASAHRGSSPGPFDDYRAAPPDRGDTVAAMLAGRGLTVARHGRDEPVAAGTEICLVDTMGELGLFYRLAGVAFIGGSLASKGGHNPFEAARLECAVLHGPDIGNCAAMAAALAEAGAAEMVSNADELASAVSRPIVRSSAARRPCGGRRPHRCSGRCSSRCRSRPARPVARPVGGRQYAIDRKHARRGSRRRSAQFARVMPNAPQFWGKPAGLTADLLSPLGLAWDRAAGGCAVPLHGRTGRRRRSCASATSWRAEPARRRWRWRSPIGWSHAGSACISSLAAIGAASPGPAGLTRPATTPTRSATSRCY